MAVVLPPDLLYSLGDTIDSRSTLAALCRVSKAFNGIFTPILYRKIRIQDCELQPLLENVSKLTSESHLRFTRELHLGRNIPRFPHSESGDGLDECLEKMSELVSLAITHSVWELNLCGDGGKALETLARRGKLRELTIIATEQQGFPTPLPIFTNLTSLLLQRLSSTAFDRVDALADSLIASPNLKHLGLANGRRNVDFSEELHRLAEAFQKRRTQTGGSILRLESLHLGAGYCPVKIPISARKGSDYLSQLTDLEYLASLSLDNHRTANPVYTPLFHSATSMKEFAASCLNKNSLDLLSYLCQANPTTLTSLSFIGLSHPHGLLYPDDERFFEDLPALIAPAPHLNHSWKSLSISQGSTKEGNHYLKDFISQCTSLEYLACPMYKSDIAIFKTFMPDLKHLQTLIITKGNFPDHVPSTVNVSAQLDARDKERAENMKWQPFSAHPEIARVSVDGQRQAKDLARERGEKIRKKIADDLFRASCDAWVARQEEDKGARLKYIGLGYRVYTWMLPGPGEKGDEWRVEQLSLDEARTFREVKKASM